MMFLSILDSQAATAAAGHSGPSAIYLIVGIIIAAAVFFYFLRKTDKLITEEKKNEPAIPEKAAATPHLTKHDDIHEEEAAAIAMALYLYKRDLHDKESFTITMQKVSRIYSPWNSKIYTLQQIPNRR